MASTRPTIHIAADHAGFERKEQVKAWLLNEGYAVHDHGAHAYDKLDDYPDFIAPAAEAVGKAPQQSRGILFGKSGQGEAMLANRYPKVRAAVFYGGEDEIIQLSRQHNDANVLSIGAGFVGEHEAYRVIWDWLHTDMHTDEKYERRNRKIERITKDIRA